MKARHPAPSLPPAAQGSTKPRATVKTTAIRMLARREYSRADLSQRLRARGFDAGEADRALDELAALGYLSDARFANGVVAQKAGRFARRAIAHELREKGVDPAAAAEALATLDANDDLADATALWKRRFGFAPRDEREKSRQYRFLLTRGYSASVALRVLRAAGAAVDDD